MAIDWDKLDKQIDINGIITDEEELGEDQQEYKEVPFGNYDVQITKMEIGVSKNGNPKAVIWFKVLAGDYKNSVIFMNQALTMRFHFGKVNKILRALESGIEEISIRPLREYNDLMMDIFEAVNGNFEYALKYGEDKKGYQTYEILDVYDVA